MNEPPQKSPFRLVAAAVFLRGGWRAACRATGLALLLGLLVAASPPGGAPGVKPEAEPGRHRTRPAGLPETLARLDSAHFSLLTDVEPTRRAGLARQLEAVYAANLALARKLAIPVSPPERRLLVVMFADRRDFDALARGTPGAPQDAFGFYDPVTNRSVFVALGTLPEIVALRAGLPPEGTAEGKRLRRRVAERVAHFEATLLRHEVAHQVQVNIGLVRRTDALPIWLAEGLAMLFEDLAEDGDWAPRRNRFRARELRRLHTEGTTTRPAVRQMLIDNATWCGGPCYGVAWAVTAYLVEFHPQALAALLQRAATDDGLPRGARKRAALFDRLFGPVNGDWVQRVQTWALRGDSSPEAR
jgi:hypothetical protein